MRMRILVADQSEADFYDLEHRTDAPHLAARLSDPVAHLHNRDLVSDRPGRFFDHAATPGARRGATARHSAGGEHEPRKHEAALFARKIAEHLERAERNGEFDRLVIMAAPAFLGLLRKALPAAVHARVAAEVAKDLVHEPREALRAHLPEDAFRASLEGSS